MITFEKDQTKCCIKWKEIPVGQFFIIHPNAKFGDEEYLYCKSSEDTLVIMKMDNGAFKLTTHSCGSDNWLDSVVKNPIFTFQLVEVSDCNFTLKFSK